jgi:hypothetical protein
MTSFSKVSEKIRYNLLTRPLNDSNIKAEEQVRFRKILTHEEASYELSN